ncbi:hypothetical protein TNCV_2366201 [Trichonephila clavipes]|nr:hypothetical protein TNCV_2366201 [Trichonephila clavipes]
MPAIEINAVNNDYGTPSNDISVFAEEASQFAINETTFECRGKKREKRESLIPGKKNDSSFHQKKKSSSP